MARIERIVKIASEETGFTFLQCENYLRRIMDYAFDEPHRQGLQEFGRHLRKMGILSLTHFPAVIGADFSMVEARANDLAQRAS